MIVPYKVQGVRGRFGERALDDGCPGPVVLPSNVFQHSHETKASHSRRCSGIVFDELTGG